MYRAIGLKFAGIQFRARNIRSKGVDRPTASDVKKIKLPKGVKERSAVFADLIRELRVKGMRDSDRIAALFNEAETHTPWGASWSADAVDCLAGPCGPK